MSAVTDPPVVRLEAFDADGIYTGHALLDVEAGYWIVTAGSVVRGARCKTREEAESILRLKGGAQIFTKYHP